jgi:hypothetical protein
MEVKLRGYVDPRTGEYVRTTKETSEEQVAEALGFLQAWKFYWDGPLSANDGQSLYDRETWLYSDGRRAWLDDITDEQRKMLEDSFPPEEVPQLEVSS